VSRGREWELVACSGFSAPADHRGRGVVGAGTARSPVPSNHASFLSWLKPARSSWSCWRCLACIWRTSGALGLEPPHCGSLRSPTVPWPTAIHRTRLSLAWVVRCFPLAGLAAEPPPTSQSTSMAPCGFLARTQSLVREHWHRTVVRLVVTARRHPPPTLVCGTWNSCHCPLVWVEKPLSPIRFSAEELFCAPRNRVANELDASAPYCSTNRSNSMPSKLQAG
jgi:hypothetical protein